MVGIPEPTLYVIVLFLLALAAPSVIWFYGFRRHLIHRHRMVVSALEQLFRPRDKNYTLLGYLVGFRADYVLDGEFSRAWILYTTPPIHVFFYLPAIILGHKRERLAITIRPRGRVPYTSHVLLAGDRWTLRTFRVDYGDERLRYCSERNGYLSCGSSQGIEKVLELGKRLERHNAVLARASLDSDRNIVHVQVLMDKASPYHVVKEIIEFAKTVSV